VCQAKKGITGKEEGKRRTKCRNRFLIRGSKERSADCCALRRKGGKRELSNQKGAYSPEYREYGKSQNMSGHGVRPGKIWKPIIESRKKAP